jgi:hypothetical protein
MDNDNLPTEKELNERLDKLKGIDKLPSDNELVERLNALGVKSGDFLIEKNNKPKNPVEELIEQTQDEVRLEKLEEQFDKDFGKANTDITKVKFPKVPKHEPAAATYINQEDDISEPRKKQPTNQESHNNISSSYKDTAQEKKHTKQKLDYNVNSTPQEKGFFDRLKDFAKAVVKGFKKIANAIKGNESENKKEELKTSKATSNKHSVYHEELGNLSTPSTPSNKGHSSNKSMKR